MLVAPTSSRPPWLYREKKMRIILRAISFAVPMVVSCAIGDAQAQGAIKLFDAIPVTKSAPCVNPFDCSPAQDRVVFDETTLLLACKAHPIAILSSTPDGRGGLVVDNFIEVNGTNACPGGTCFNFPANPVLGMSAADTYTRVPPIDISALMPRKGPEFVNFSLVDFGDYYASTDVWLVTDCRLHHKVNICHKPGTPAEKILTVGVSALGGHLGHGDSLDLAVCRGETR
jgi:hypothetical protein